ncbi:nuclease SbcCD subunit D [Paenibacillus swuensis]|uniref:Nuclease SbcCD subunit D n=1 Tax=Paenibacillus swuensis TaxID=1178515 RepID=A0A172TJS3_9BACL|nr:exonuclease SbcCD subunit D [Paenibacillus swuensis]ANE47309.1 nuclease SbcCD subunit D [Paenibacillus swuensis]
MRILHTADWHLGRMLEGRGRLEEQAAFVDEIIEIVEREGIDLVLIAGDVYDTVNPPAAAEQLFYEGVSRLSDGGRRPVVVIAGNHDNPDRIAAAGPLANERNITLVGLPTANVQEIGISRTGERAKLFSLPYPSESRLREVLTDSTDEAVLRGAYTAKVAHLVAQQAPAFGPDTVNLLMSHIYVLGGAETDSERPIQVGGAYTVDTAALTAQGLQYVALGHLHRPQTLKASVPIRYSGSPLAYSFSEAGQAKSVTILEAAPGQPVQLREVFLSSGHPLVRWRAVQGISQVHAWFDEGKDLAAWIDLELHLTEALSMEQIQTLRKERGKLVNIRVIYPDTLDAERSAAREELPIDELFRRFYTKQTGGAEADAETIRLFLELVGESGDASERGDAS